MNETPRSRVINSLKNGTIDYVSLMNVLKEQITRPCQRDRRFDTLKRGMEEVLNFDEPMLDEPYEDIRKLALVTDCFSVLAHIQNDMDDYNRARFLRAQKDILMTRLALECIRANEENKAQINIGYRPEPGDQTLELDIPYLGHIGWHFGRRENMTAFIDNTDRRIERYTREVEPKVMQGPNRGTPYSNAELLLGEVRTKDLNNQDKKLVNWGRTINVEM